MNKTFHFFSNDQSVKKESITYSSVSRGLKKSNSAFKCKLQIAAGYGETFFHGSAYTPKAVISENSILRFPWSKTPKQWEEILRGEDWQGVAFEEVDVMEWDTFEEGDLIFIEPETVVRQPNQGPLQLSTRWKKPVANEKLITVDTMDDFL